MAKQHFIMVKFTSHQISIAKMSLTVGKCLTLKVNDWELMIVVETGLRIEYVRYFPRKQTD